MSDERFKVVTEGGPLSGVTLKAETGKKADPSGLTQEDAEKLATIANAKAEGLGIATRYTVVPYSGE